LSSQISEQIARLTASGCSDLLKGIGHGIEKEGLRVLANGRLSQAPHPQSLGSALTHSRITTDYSEALLEFITPVFCDINETLGYLEDLHRFTYSKLDGELIWSSSMPGYLEGAQDIPIAEYGSSNAGRLKHIYRVGLEHRYGRTMQAIAGIHYNFSLPETFWPIYQQIKGENGSLQAFQSNAYFQLIRNFRRYSWLLLYLFGASPALSRSFMQGQPHYLEELDKQTLFSPYATSLRMSDLGYSNQAQSQLNICYNRLDNYLDTLQHAIRTPYPPYEELGVKVDNRYRQLNTCILQIENEYYSDIRPKRVTDPGEKPIRALQARGVEYIEVRSLDINPFLPVGIDTEQARFMDCFLLYCLLEKGDEIGNAECERIINNSSLVVRQGRDPELHLNHNNELRTVTDWGLEVLEGIQQVAELMDAVHGGFEYGAAITAQESKLHNSELTPSARVLKQLREQRFTHDEFVMQQSADHKNQLIAAPISSECQLELDELATRSLRLQIELEASDTLPFDDYLRDFLSQ
jgi:glutamate--cysteine ligase